MNYEVVCKLLKFPNEKWAAEPIDGLEIMTPHKLFDTPVEAINDFLDGSKHV